MSGITALFLKFFIEKGGFFSGAAPLAKLYNAPNTDFFVPVGGGKTHNIANMEVCVGFMRPLAINADTPLADEGSTKAARFGKPRVIKPEV